MEIFLISIKIVILAAVICALFKYTPDYIKKNGNKTISREILLILLAFLLALITDDIKGFLSEQKEKEAIITILKMELAEMHAIINSNLKTIERNLQILEQDKQVIAPLMLLDTSAWESAKLRNNVFLKETADLFCLVHLYAAVHLLNEEIRYREYYRITNEAMSNYNSKLAKIDKRTEKILEKTKQYLEQAQTALDKIHKLKVKGRSFSTDDKGLVY